MYFVCLQDEAWNISLLIHAAAVGRCSRICENQRTEGCVDQR